MPPINKESFIAVVEYLSGVASAASFSMAVKRRLSGNSFLPHRTQRRSPFTVLFLVWCFVVVCWG
ncbi:hypothetical protein, partial [uncultured Corynebacterium sp.]|uniref:hypothetical protein n=1 Tax=uncultured Corynebacterium sp. TaxID=159447 RepID=UPI0025FF39F9